MMLLGSSVMLEALQPTWEQPIQSEGSVASHPCAKRDWGVQLRTLLLLSHQSAVVRQCRLQGCPAHVSHA